MNIQNENESIGLITVPADATEESLIASLKKELRFDYHGDDYHFDDDYQSWKFFRDDAGKTFEVLSWDPRHRVTCVDVREHFKALKADGNTAAFLAWIAQNDPEGGWITIPSVDERLFRCPNGHLHIPSFWGGDEDYRELSLTSVGHRWGCGHTFIAFREVKNDTP